MARRRRWNVELGELKYPIVQSIEIGDSLYIRLRGGDRSFAIKCETVVAVQLIDEQLPFQGVNPFGCAVIVEDSDWFESLGVGPELLVDIYGKLPVHYGIYTANWIIEFLSADVPAVTPLEGRDWYSET